MDFQAIRVSLKRKLIVAFSISLLAGTFAYAGFIPDASCATSNAQTLEKLENWLFFATFPTESDEDRIKRLEERTFGEASSGDISERLKKLDELLSERQKEKEAANPPPSSSPSSSSAEKTPAAQPDTAPDPAREAELAKERERIRVQAAREREMEDLLREASKLFRAHRQQEALEQFEQVLRLDPQNAEANFSIGIIKESQGKLKEAKQHYSIASQKDPGNKDYTDAIAAVTKRINTVDPSKALEDKATQAFKNADYITAVNLFKQIDDKNPKQANIKYGLGTTYLMMKNYFNALENFKIAYQLEPNNEKYAKAFNELSAEMSKHQAEQQAIETQYNGGGTNATGAGGGVMGGGMTQPGMGMPAQGSRPPMGYQNQGMQQRPMQSNMQQPMLQQNMQQRPMQGMGNYNPQMQQGYGNYPQQQAMRPNPQMSQQGNYSGGSSSGTYIPPDPQLYSTKQNKESPKASKAAKGKKPETQAAGGTQGGAGGQQGGYGGGQQGGYGGGQQGGYGSGQQGGYGGGQQGGYGGGQHGGYGGGQQGGYGGGQQGGYGVGQQGGYGGSQQTGYGGGQQGGNGGGQMGINPNYAPPPQSAPQGAFDPKLAQRLNSASSGGQVDPMSNYGLSGKASEEGVLVTGIRSGTRAARSGLKKGDVIRTVDGNEVMQPDQLNQVLSQYGEGQTLPILIFREGNLTPIQF